VRTFISYRHVTQILAALILAGSIDGGTSMATGMHLTWEWPAGRQPARTLVIRVVQIEPADFGMFGAKKSPSIVEGIPEPVLLSGSALHGASSSRTQFVSITLPQLEAHGIASGDIAAIGLLDDKVCICLRKLQSPDEDQAGWQC
jgi:hypothetical protein